MIAIDLQSRLPIYEQLKTQIGAMVLAGQLHPHDQLPSVRSFARELGINPNTVQKAYQDLERDGIIYSVSGRGSYISPDEKLTSRLRGQYLRALTTAARGAKSSGISRQEAVAAVDEVYHKEEGQHDSDA